MKLATKPKSDPKRAGKAYAEDNRAIAERALADPEQYPHLQEWARRWMERNTEK